MKKNPGRRERRALAKKNRTRWSEKKQAMNERKMLWIKNGTYTEHIARLINNHKARKALTTKEETA